MIKKIIESIDSEINYLFFRRFRYARTVRRHLAKYYTDAEPLATNEKKMIVYMADGVIYRSGLADRLRGMLTLYDYCKEHGFDFRINFTDPFCLEKYLLPAKYDWTLNPGELSKNKRCSMPVYVDTRRDQGDREKRWQKATFDYYFNKDFKQAHVYTIFDYAEDRFPSLFNELFKLSPALEKNLEKATGNLGDGYISISTRFLELLGDFKESKPMVSPLSEKDANELIELCLSKINEIHKSECLNGEKVLVTSDSIRFLNAAKVLDFVEVIEGNIGHLSVKNNNRDEIDMKTMVDFFAISKARKSFLLLSGDMYPSNFSRRAAQIGGHEFAEIKF